MGVTGLWRLIEPTGKPVPVETLENKVLAVDISIWLHQMVKGYQDAKGAPLPNAHLIGLFQRLCKLLYFRIKPIFVFDGAFPELKEETIAKRQDNKSKYHSESERLKRELALLLSKKTAISSLLGKQTSPKIVNIVNDTNNDDLFKLPALPKRDQETESESDSEDEQNSSGSVVDLHSVDIESQNFKSLPVKQKYDLLIELKETRKMNSWGKLHELPKKSDNFSDFQMQRLLKRRKVQECLEETEKEMGDSGMSLNELESLLNQEGIDTKIDNLPTRRIASSDTTRFLLINNVKQALAAAKKKKDAESSSDTCKIEEENPAENAQSLGKDELQNDLQKAIQMSLECFNDRDTSAHTSKTDDSWTSFLSDSDYSNTDSEEGDGFEQPDMNSAKAYIMQYSDFTHQAIDEIIAPRTNVRNRPETSKVTKKLKELNQEETVVVSNIDLPSDEGPKNYSGSNQSVNSQHFESFNNDGTTQQSIICLENSVQSVISLDTSTEENVNPTEKNYVTADFNSNKDSDSSDEDFEEVSEQSNEVDKSVVQLTLNMGEKPEDDIFADVFAPKKEENSKIEDTKITVELERDQNNENNEKSSKTFEKKVNDCNRIKIIETPTERKQIVENIDIDKTSSQEPVSIKINEPPKVQISDDQLNSMAAEMQNEEQDLLSEKGRLDRIGRNITEQMTKEAQELLQIFGIPYIIAPMEAEAQCAFLENVKLTDGTITDDSDIWLFGGRTVYKNFFNQKKHVLQFLGERIEKSFNLTREQLILLALLVGSDYTTGVTGVGPVTALEILASFPFNKKNLINETSRQAHYAQIVAGLREFKEWVKTGKKTDNTSLKKKLRNVILSEDFPSVRVVQAYLEPNVEKSEEKFTWGELDITILRDYTKAKFGWSQNKLDEIIKPVLKRILDCKNQKTIEDYFKKKIKIQSLESHMSKRVKAAVQRMGSETPLEEQNIHEKEITKLVRKRKIIKKQKVSELEKDTVSNDKDKAVPTEPKRGKKSDKSVLNDHTVKVISQIQDNKSSIEINIPKSDRYQETIPQREKDKQNLLQNKMKAIELFRKTKIVRKRKTNKKRVNLPKEKAELSESSDSD